MSLKSNLDSGKVRQLTHDNALVLSPAWSADGRFIYFASSRGGTLNIWKIAENGSQLEQITSGQGDDAHLDISVDGKRMVFSSFRVNVNVAQLDLRAAVGIPKSLIADTAEIIQSSYSPDGGFLPIFPTSKVSKIWLANSDGSRPAIGSGWPRKCFSSWTRDSEAGLFVLCSSQIHSARNISLFISGERRILC